MLGVCIGGVKKDPLLKLRLPYWLVSRHSLLYNSRPCPHMGMWVLYKPCHALPSKLSSLCICEMANEGTDYVRSYCKRW